MRDFSLKLFDREKTTIRQNTNIEKACGNMGIFYRFPQDPILKNDNFLDDHFQIFKVSEL